jgi:CheY-like chemotaxis protein
MSKVGLTCIIDDDQVFTLVTKKLLMIKEFSTSIISFSNGEEALNFLFENADCIENIPDMIFLDINMPKIDGWEFLEKIKLLKLPKSVKIYMLTSSINPVDIAKSKTYENVTGYLNKPLKVEDLLQVV